MSFSVQEHEVVPWELPGKYPESGLVRLAYRWDSGHGFPVVALHGSLLCSDSFSFLAGQLPGCRLLAVDLPGHGASERVFNGLANIGAMASAVSALLERLGVYSGSFGLIGHSMGGAVGLLVARKAPRLPAFYVSIEGVDMLEDCTKGGIARTLAARETTPSAAEVLEIVAKFDSPTGVWTKAATSLGETLGVFAQKLFTGFVEWCESTELPKMFVQIPCVRFLYGENSGKYHAARRDALQRHVNASARGIPESGHFMLYEKPQDTIAALRDLLCDAVPKKTTAQEMHRQAKRRRQTVESLAQLPPGQIGNMNGGGVESFLESFGARPALGVDVILQLQKWNTPTIFNGWEQITSYNFGLECFNLEPIMDHMPQMGVMVGYAVTVQINPGNPAVPRDAGSHRQAFREHVASLPTNIPKIVVVQDLDKPKLLGSMWGEVNANFFKALGCIGCLTDGAVRDIDEMTTAGFHAMSRGVCIGHAWGGIPVRWDLPVEVFGVTVRPGQLIHADKHGFLVVPEEDEARLLEASEFMDLLERKHTIRVSKEGCNKTGLEVAADMKEASRCFGDEKNNKFSGINV